MIWLMEILAADKLLCNEAFNIAKNLKYDGYQRELASMVYIFFFYLHLVVVLKMRFFQTNYYLKNYTKQLLESLIKEKYIHLL